MPAITEIAITTPATMYDATRTCGFDAAKYPITVIATAQVRAPTMFAVANRAYDILLIPAIGAMNTRPHGM